MKKKKIKALIMLEIKEPVKHTTVLSLFLIKVSFYVSKIILSSSKCYTYISFWFSIFICQLQMQSWDSTFTISVKSKQKIGFTIALIVKFSCHRIISANWGCRHDRKNIYKFRDYIFPENAVRELAVTIQI